MYMLQIANYFLESGERSEACFLQDPSWTLGQLGILGMDSFKLYLSVCPSQLGEQRVCTGRINRATYAASSASSLCFVSTMWLWRQSHWLHCHVTNFQLWVHWEQRHCVRGEGESVGNALEVESDVILSHPIPLCARVKGVTSVLEPWDANSSCGDRANSLSFGLISTKL